MKILLGIGHPADVHFFKYFINDLKNKGHEVYVAAREKEITYYLTLAGHPIILLSSIKRTFLIN